MKAGGSEGLGTRPTLHVHSLVGPDPHVWVWPRETNVYGGLHFRSNIVDSMEYCEFHAFSQELCSANVMLTEGACIASGLQRVPGRVISMKLHPQEACH